MTQKYKNKSNNSHHYLVILGIIIGLGLITLYIWEWHKVKLKEEYYNSYLIETNTINLEMNNINEISSVLSETPSYYFIYISYTQDKNVYNLEKDLKPLIDEYKLANNFYYFNVTNIRNKNKNYLQEIAQQLHIDAQKVEKVPIILYFKDGELQQDGVYSAQDFRKLLEDNDVSNM